MIKRFFNRAIAALMIISAVLTAACGPVMAADTVPAVEEIPLPAPDPVDLFLAQSAFVGNSVGEGLTMYNNAMKKIPLGNATMLTRVSYSFYSDANRMSKYMPVLNGQAMQAKDAIKLSGAKYAFICMGTNDLVGSSAPENAFAKYKEYLAGIMTENPEVTIFIESCTPTRPGSNVNNDKVTVFNSYMQVYCDMFPNMFYVDIATPLKDETGYLSKALCSDGSVHLTYKAYEIWSNTIRAYITNFLVARAAAIREANEQERAKAQANYRAKMREMDQKKKAAHEMRMQAKREAQEAEEARRREQLLNVPDEVTLMHTLTATRTEKEYPRIVGLFLPFP